MTIPLRVGPHPALLMMSALLPTRPWASSHTTSCTAGPGLMPAGFCFCSVLLGAMFAHVEMHYNVTGSPATLLGPEEAEKIGLPKTEALESRGHLSVGI